MTASKEKSKNITLSVPQSALQRARIYALKKNTSLTELIRQYVLYLSAYSESSKEQIANKLSDSFSKYSRDMSLGSRSWTREDLYKR